MGKTRRRLAAMAGAGLAAAVTLSAAAEPSLTLELNQFTGDTAAISLEITQPTASRVQFDLTLTTPGSGDLSAFYVKVDPSFSSVIDTMSLVTAGSSDVSNWSFDSAMKIKHVGSPAYGLNGGGSPQPWHAGFVIGNGPGNDGIMSTSILLDLGQPISMNTLFDGATFGARAMSLGFDGEGSSKLSGTLDVPTGGGGGGGNPVPEPTTGALLACAGLAIFRRPKR